jgi:hypothetical protein
VRYLIVLPPDRLSVDPRFHDVECGEVAVGDELLVDELLVRVHSVVDVPADDGYDGTLVCEAAR